MRDWRRLLAVLPSTRPPVVPRAVPADRPRFLAEADCHAIGARLAAMATGGGETIATITSTWRGNVRWARNRITTAGEDRNDEVVVNRTFGQENNTFLRINETSDAVLRTAVRRAEQLIRLRHEVLPAHNAITDYVPEGPINAPPLFFEATYQLAAEDRADVARQLAQLAEPHGLLSAGYLEVSATSLARIASWGVTRYEQYTWAQVSVTVRDPQGTGSGWAGVDWPDWTRIDAPALAALAVDTCLRSRNPVAIEPGRYTTILEPQAVCDFVGELVYGAWGYFPLYQMLDRALNTTSSDFPFNRRPGVSQVGERVVDERITIRADPLDPELGFPPIELWPAGNSGSSFDEVYHPATWIAQGVLTHLADSRGYVGSQDSPRTGLPNEGAFRMSVTGPTPSLAEMIATTRRGLLVTRLSTITKLEVKSLAMRGYTRDGLWLIEQGQISKPVKNMVFTESILGALNRVEQLGPPQRAFHPAGEGFWSLPQPVVVPPLKIRDFSFTALTTAV